MKVWDVQKPRDNWERGFAKLNFEWTGLRQVGNRKIDIKDDKIFVCKDCGIFNDFWDWNCSKCDAINQMSEDQYRDKL